MFTLLPVSAIVFTKNEALNIKECISSLSNFNEVIVVDSMSDDETCNIAISHGARVVNFDWNFQYPKKRQWSLEEIEYKNDWILFIDADERVNQALVDEIAKFLFNGSKEFSAASIPIDYFFAGKQLKYGQKPRKTVLLRLGFVNFPIIDDLESTGMGELEGHYQPTIYGRTKKLKSGIVHNDNDPISSWMSRHVKYAMWEAHLITNKEAKKKVDESKGRLGAIFHRLPLKPFIFFLYSFIFKLGFLDGKTGFDYAFAKSWYYWLSEVIARENNKYGK